MATGGQPENSLKRQFSWQRLQESGIHFLLVLCATLSIVTTLAIVAVLFGEAVFSKNAFFREVSLYRFFTDLKWTPQYGEGNFGILPLLCGTLLITGIAAVIGLPIGLLSAIYLSEYASPRVRATVKPMLEILAGIPTVVYGYFALVFITPYMLQPLNPFFDTVFGFEVGLFNAFSAGVVVGVMIIPMVSSLSEDVLRAVPRGLREAGYALGATRYDVSVKVVVPAGLSGVLASFLLAISRALGETMAVTMAAGFDPKLTFNPFEDVGTMTAAIVNVAGGDADAGSVQYQGMYAVALTLFVITLIMNIISQFILNRYREVYH